MGHGQEEGSKREVRKERRKGALEFHSPFHGHTPAICNSPMLPRVFMGQLKPVKEAGPSGEPVSPAFREVEKGQSL